MAVQHPYLHRNYHSINHTTTTLNGRIYQCCYTTQLSNRGIIPVDHADTFKGSITTFGLTPQPLNKASVLFHHTATVKMDVVFKLAIQQHPLIEKFNLVMQLNILTEVYNVVKRQNCQQQK